jgi:hypothetical protein
MNLINYMTLTVSRSFDVNVFNVKKVKITFWNSIHTCHSMHLFICCISELSLTLTGIGSFFKHLFRIFQKLGSIKIHQIIQIFIIASISDPLLLKHNSFFNNKGSENTCYDENSEISNLFKFSYI